MQQVWAKGEFTVSYIIGGYILGLSIVDIKQKKLPLWILASGCIVSGIYSVIYLGLLSTTTGAIPGIALLIISFLLPQSVGKGDGLLAVIYGFLYGWIRTCVWLMLGFWCAAVFGLFCRFFSREKNLTIPFVPFLLLVHVGMCL